MELHRDIWWECAIVKFSIPIMQLECGNAKFWICVHSACIVSIAWNFIETAKTELYEAEELLFPSSYVRKKRFNVRISD